MLTKATLLLSVSLIVVCLHKERRISFVSGRRLSIISDGDPLDRSQLAEQQTAKDDCLCVFHYLCDKNYNLITDGVGIIDPRIDANGPPQTVCSNPAQICCRIPNGVVIPTSQSTPVVSATSPPGSTAASTTTSTTTSKTTPPTTTTKGTSAATMPGTVILPTIGFPTNPPQTTSTVSPSTATTPTTTKPTTPTTVAVTTTTSKPTAPPVTTSTAATTTPAATTSSQRPTLTSSPSSPPTPSPMTIPTAPPTTKSSSMSSPTTVTATTQKPTTAKPTVGPPGSSCGVRYVPVSQSENAESYLASFAEFPWMLAVLNSTALTMDGTVVANALVAGASLISKNIALTGAHRIRNFVQNPSTLIIRAGEWDIVTANEPLPHQDRTVQRILIHDDFNSSTLFNDIALLKLQEPVVFANHVVLICLPEFGQTFSGSCIATGWGKDAFDQSGKYQRKMRKVSLPIVDYSTCQKKLRDTRLGFAFTLNPSFMCAGGQKNLDTCTGDGGGPLVCPSKEGTYTQVGIVSWGIGCGSNDVPGVYVDVQYFRKWIDSGMSQVDRDTVPRILN